MNVHIPTRIACIPSSVMSLMCLLDCRRHIRYRKNLQGTLRLGSQRRYCRDFLNSASRITNAPYPVWNRPTPLTPNLRPSGILYAFQNAYSRTLAFRDLQVSALAQGLESCSQTFATAGLRVQQKHIGL
jgi:hypothetical protein